MAIRWDRIGQAGGIQALATLAGIDPVDAPQRKRLQAAVTELRQALDGSQADESAGQPSAALDGWIDRHLVAPGDTLLISEDDRRGRLDRLRDQDRRRRHSDRGLEAKRIEMPAESWRKLRLAGEDFDTHTFGETLRRLINLHTAPKLSGSSGKPPPTGQQTLMLEPDAGGLDRRPSSTAPNAKAARSPA